MASLHMLKILMARDSKFLARFASMTAVKALPTIAVRVKRAARSVGSAVRQTFTARKAAKSADSGGGSSDPDGRPQTESSIFALPVLTVSPIFAFLFGGAK